MDGDETALHLPGEQMAQAIVALIKNAIDASEPGEPVLVELARTATDVHVAVEDRGDGIPEHLLAKVGEPFFTTKQPGRGLGLGVFLARAFVESRGRSLSIESTPGAGTRATVRLPLAQMAVATEAT
jgi:two-component system sensor histidine kinase RegB